jgi:hypothetical protein
MLSCAAQYHGVRPYAGLPLVTTLFIPCCIALYVAVRDQIVTKNAGAGIKQCLHPRTGTRSGLNV